MENDRFKLDIYIYRSAREHFLQHGPRCLVIEAFRGVGKSWITAAFVCWLLSATPNSRSWVVSASAERANGFSTFTLQLIRDMPFLRHLQPRADQRQSMVAFNVGPANPTRARPSSHISVGITGQLTGSRADVIVPDDIEIPGNA